MVADYTLCCVRYISRTGSQAHLYMLSPMFPRHGKGQKIEMITCTKCGRPLENWPVGRPPVCSPKWWACCIRPLYKARSGTYVRSGTQVGSGTQGRSRMIPQHVRFSAIVSDCAETWWSECNRLSCMGLRPSWSLYYRPADTHDGCLYMVPDTQTPDPSWIKADKDFSGIEKMNRRQVYNLLNTFAKGLHILTQ